MPNDQASTLTISPAVASSRLRQLDILERDLMAFISRSSDPEAVGRAKDRITRIEAARTVLMGGKQPNQRLAEAPFKPWRALTFAEKRVNFKSLSNSFNRNEDAFKKTMTLAVGLERARLGVVVKNKLKTKDVAAVATLAVMLRGTTRAAVKGLISSSYNAGRVSAQRESAIGSTPVANQTQKLMTLEAADAADAFNNNVEAAVKGTIKAGIAAGASDEGIITAAQRTFDQETAKGVDNMAGTYSGQYVNRGRMDVFATVTDRIVSYTWSAAMENTCDFCYSLDGRTFAPDDPLASLDIVHTNCHCISVPNWTTDEEPPEIEDIPASIMDNFKTIDGKPVVNSFKQLKKPIKD